MKFINNFVLKLFSGVPQGTLESIKNTFREQVSSPREGENNNTASPHGEAPGNISEISLITLENLQILAVAFSLIDYYPITVSITNL